MIRKSKSLLFILLVQVILMFVTFPNVMKFDEDATFQNRYDGIKNYFTLQSYVNQQNARSIWKYDQMNYPYGDYIFYTDNTPLFAVPIKWVCNKVLKNNEAAIPIFNFLILFNIILCSLFLFLLLKELLNSKILIVLLAIALPWLSPQFMRLGVGHMNLSLSFLFVMQLYLLVKAAKHFYAPKAKKFVLCIVAITLTMVLSTFIHIYFLLLLATLTGFFALFYLLFNIKKPLPEILKRIALLATPIIALAVSLLLIKTFDQYYDLRRVGAEGYNYDQWRLQFKALFTPYPHSFLRYFFLKKASIPYESFAYIGLFGLIALIRAIPYSIIKTFQVKFRIHKLFKTEKDILVLIILLAGFGSLFIAFGNQILWGKVDNYLSPLFYLHKISDRFTQFRCLGRFSWAFFWTFNIALAFMLDKRMQRGMSCIWYLPTALLVILVMVDMGYNINQQRNNGLKHNPLLNDTLIENMVSQVDLDEYQAILALPYYHAGSENYNYTIDPPNDDYNTKTFQVSLIANLPLINCKMSRTGVDQTKKLINAFLFDENLPTFADDLPNDKSILVFVDRNLCNDLSWLGNKREPANKAGQNSCKILDEKPSELLVKVDQFELHRLQLN